MTSFIQSFVFILDAKINITIKSHNISLFFTYNKKWPSYGRNMLILSY